MSGDVQPRKRKDKRRKKDDGDPILEKLPTPIFTNNTVTDDTNANTNIHVHKEGGTGGGICAKLVFFVLFSALVAVIGLIITQHRGLTDIDTIDPNSKFSQLFEGWVDTNGGDHHDVEDEDHDHYELEEDDHHDHDDHEDDDEEHGDDEDEHGDDDDDHEDEEDDHEEENLSDVDANDQEQSEEAEDDANLEDDEDDDEDENKNDSIGDLDDEEESYIYNPYSGITSKRKKTVSDEEEKDQDDDEDQEQDDENDDDNEDIDEQEEANDNEDDLEQAHQDDDDQEDDEDEDDNVMVSREKRDISEEKLDNKDEELDNDDDDNENDVDDNDHISTEDDDNADNDEDNEKDLKNDENKIDSSETEAQEEQTTLDKEGQPDLGAEQAEGGDDEPLKADPETANELKDGALESSSMAVKLGVGVALLVVAHLVLVKKWRTVSDDDDKAADNPSIPNIQDRRNTIIVPPSFKEVEPDIEQVQEDYSQEEDVEDDEKAETNIAKMKYQELATAYTNPAATDKRFDIKQSPETYDYDDDEDIDDEQEDEELEEEEEDEEGESDEGEGEDYDEEIDEEDEDEELLKRLEARYGTLQKFNVDKAAEKRESDSDNQSDDDYDNITNEDDHKIRTEIDKAQNSIKSNNALAIVLFDKILQKFPSSPRSLYGKALALDHLAETKRSNDVLKRALLLYEQLLKTDKVPTALFKLAADRCINRWRFLGQYKSAINIHKIIINKFPNNPKHLNSLAVTYLTINRVEEARTIFKQVLVKWPDDGFALVHYGFILKTTDNELEKAVRYLEKGILTKDEGVLDGRFYFHLGDALARLSRHDCALKIYEEGTRNKVFLSKFQRSLYNVPRLSAKPWWLPEDLPYSNSLRLLAASWKKIKEEGLAVLNEKGFFQDESENLKDTGEWKQFELFARGHKHVNNCKKCPFTCSIIDQISEANSCRRGQTKFSVMHPGTHVWPHCGPTNCRLRVHLGLKVPPKTFIRVATETRSWKEGEFLIFDDSFEHEVWHNGTEFRLILIVDVWHPELTPSERSSLSPI